MLTQRLTKPFRVISIYDEATLEIPDKVMTIYSQTRDFSLVEKHLEKLEKKATVFHLRPLRADKEYLAESILSEGSGAYWQIFRHHVSKAENFVGEDGTPIIKLDEDSLVDHDCKEAIPRDIVQEMASVIIHKANESTKPFTMPDTWLRTRIRSRTLLVASASLKNASENDTE